jgi:tripartite-type tricarboxylate transporter receptor subunit TctC
MLRLATVVALALAALPVSLTPAFGQSAADWPNKSVRVIVNFGPGGSADNTMRPFAERLSKSLGQQFVIENRGGASGALGLEAMAKSAPDGYTFAVTPALSVIILPHLRKTPYDPLKDLQPVARMTDGTLLFAVHPSIPANTIAEFIEYGKKNQGKISWGTAGVGSYGHIMAEVFKMQSKLDILHVPYRGGGESLADFLAGVVQIHADPNTMPHVSAGKAKLLAVLDRKRLPDFPNVPVMSEIFPEMDFLAWFAMYAPAGTPAPIISKLVAEMKKIAAEPDMTPLLAKTALAPSVSTPEELAALTAKDHARFGKIIKEANIKAE